MNVSLSHGDSMSRATGARAHQWTCLIGGGASHIAHSQAVMHHSSRDNLLGSTAVARDAAKDTACCVHGLPPGMQLG